MPSSEPAQTVRDTLGLSRKRRRVRTWWVVAAVVVVAVVLCAGGIWMAARNRGVEWETREAEKGELVGTVTAVGTLEPVHEVDVASEQSGVVDEVLVDVNDRVTAGQVMARLQTDTLEAQRRQVSAALAASKASLLQAQVTAKAAAIDLDRATTLSDRGASSAADLDRARAASDQSRAAVEVAEAQVRQVQAQLDGVDESIRRTVITSPLDGIVLRRSIDPGQTVVSAMSAATLFVVAENLDRMKVDVAVDEADIGRVSAGQTATFTVAAWPNRVFQAVVDKVDLAPTASASVVTYTASLLLDNPDGALRPGMTATAEIAVERYEDALLVPNAALRFRPPGDESAAPAPRNGKRVSRVWHLVDGVPTAIEVVVGATDGFKSVVTEGELEAGAALVVSVKSRSSR